MLTKLGTSLMIEKVQRLTILMISMVSGWIKLSYLEEGGGEEERERERE